MTDKQDIPEDIPPDAGKRPPTARPVDAKSGDDIGTGNGYSGQEYDGEGQAKWRAEQVRHSVPADGHVEGSGSGAGGQSPGEDYDTDGLSGGSVPG